MFNFLLIFVVLLAGCSLQLVQSQCSLSQSLIQEIRSYQTDVQQIIYTVLNGNFKGRLFNDTAEFVDTVGATVVGSQALDNGIDYMLKWMSDQFFDDVHGEDITTPNLIRGKESLEMLEPRYQSLSILGYGKSIGTEQPIEAEIIVVKDYDELEQRSLEVPDKIVVYDQYFRSICRWARFVRMVLILSQRSPKKLKTQLVNIDRENF